MVALLRSKRVLHAAAEFLSSTDMEVLIRFLVIAGIVFPLLPDQAVDPFYGVVRPRDVWRMVVLISGLSFAGYVLMRIRAGHSGYLVTGLLSGLVSSTAATLAYSRAARSNGNARQHELLIAFAASTSFVRILVLLAVAAPATLPGLVLPLSAMSLTGLGLGFARHRPSALPSQVHDFSNPLTLRVAVAFAAIYATVLLLLAFARDRLAEAGVYTLAAAAALGGADAPILSLARLTDEGYLAAGTASVGIAVVAIAATIGKLVILLAVGPGLSRGGSARPSSRWPVSAPQRWWRPWRSEGEAPRQSPRRRSTRTLSRRIVSFSASKNSIRGTVCLRLCPVSVL